MSDAQPYGPLSTAMQAEPERELGRQQRALAVEQRHLADIDDTPIGTIRRRAAELYDAAARVHEEAAEAIERAARSEASP